MAEYDRTTWLRDWNRALLDGLEPVQPDESDPDLTGVTMRAHAATRLANAGLQPRCCRPSLCLRVRQVWSGSFRSSF
jgi:hypothetical protein